MKRSYLFLALACAAVCGAVMIGSSQAQPATASAVAGSKVAVCDVVHAFNNYTRAGDLTAKLDKRRQDVEAENEKRLNEIKAIGKDMEGLKEGSDEFEKQFKEVQRLSIDRDAWFKFQTALAIREHFSLSREMYKEVIAMVEKVAGDEGYDIVLYKESGDLRSRDTQELVGEIARRRVLYSAAKTDITTLVLTRLNNSYSGGK